MKVLKLNVNGAAYSVEADADASLLTVLREHLDLTGSKYGCGEGQCGACTVLVDGTPRRSCVTPAATAVGKKIITIEGLASGEKLHPVQEAFIAEDALQCGYCTSGMVLSAAALLQTNPHPSEKEIVEFMQGNVCRCGTYPRIIAAIRRAAGVGKEARR